MEQVVTFYVWCVKNIKIDLTERMSPELKAKKAETWVKKPIFAVWQWLVQKTVYFRNDENGRNSGSLNDVWSSGEKQ